MSLSERVQRAGNDATEEAPEALPAIVSRIRNQVQDLISADEIAALARSNPERARNEVRSACRRVLERPEWESVDAEKREALTCALIDLVFGFGPLEDLINDEEVTEVMVNGPSCVYFERAGRLFKSDREFASEPELRALIDRILGPTGRRIDEASPLVNTRLPQGHRVNVVVPPIALNGPTVTIRKFTEHVLTLEDLRMAGSFDDLLQRFLSWAVRARKSIAVSGGTGSGKTTLLNALSCEIAPDERIVTIEDSAELRFFEHPHVIGLEARPRNAEGSGEVSIRDLVTNALRMRPDRIVVGECRGAEALDMLQAMNTGHDGSLTTLHANSPAESVARLTTMVRFGADLPADVIESNIASALDLVVQMRRSMDGSRRIAEVVRFSFDRRRGRCETNQLYVRDVGADAGRWIEFPEWMDDLPALGVANEKEVAEWRRQACSQAA